MSSNLKRHVNSNSNKNLKKIKDAQKTWEKNHYDKLEMELKEEFKSEEDILIKRLYTPLDLEEKGFDYLECLGFPGDFPFTRGITPKMYRGKLWSMSQYSGYGTPEESNELWRAQIEAGSTGIAIAYDLPTQIGYDPDHLMSEGEVGRIGISMVSLRDWEVAFEKIDLDKVQVAQIMNALGGAAIAMHLVLAEKRGNSWKKLQGSCQNDVLKEYVARGTHIFPPIPSIRFTSDTLAFCAQHVPEYNPITVCSLHFSERGANRVHEAAFAIADAIAYVEGAVSRGIDVDKIGPGIIWLTSHEHFAFFHEIAKIRAMRRIWANLMRNRFKAKDPRSMMMRIRSSESGSSLTKEQYLNNIGRIAIAALAGVLAGIQLLDLRCYDEQYGIPTKEAQITNIRLQQIVAHETQVAETIDPLAGSYYVETLTAELEERIWEELEKIDNIGGAVRAIEQGYFQKCMSDDAYQYQLAFQVGEVKRVGVNCFRSEMEDQRPTKVYRTDPKVEEKRKKDVVELRKNRDNSLVERCLKDLKDVAREETTAENNVMPAIIETVKAYGTMGEMAEVLREVWGEYKEATFI